MIAIPQPSFVSVTSETYFNISTICRYSIFYIAITFDVSRKWGEMHKEQMEHTKSHNIPLSLKPGTKMSGYHVILQCKSTSQMEGKLRLQFQYIATYRNKICDNLYPENSMWIYGLHQTL
jgi:hypothetical protein